MKDEYIFIETEQYKKEATKWLSALKRQENVIALFIPKTDRLTRIIHLLSDKKLLQKNLGNLNKYIFLKMAFNSEDIHEVRDCEFQICKQLNLLKPKSSKRKFTEWIRFFKKNSQTLVLVLPEAEIYLNKDNRHILTYISQLNEHFAPTLLILSLFEVNFSHPSNLSLLPASTRIYENIFPYPLYSIKDTNTFIHFLSKLWNIIVTDKTESNIIDICGGHFWIVKQAVREISSFGEWNINSEGMIFRLRTIFQQFHPSEQNVIKKAITGKKITDKDELHSLKYLQQMNVIDKNKHCLIKGFEELILHPQTQIEEIILKDNHVYVNMVPVDKMFTRKELSVLKLFLEQTNKIVSRDEIAQKMWPINTQDDYSDWAIDQLIKRIRNSLKELSLSPKIIEVVRNKGYRLNLQQSII